MDNCKCVYKELYMYFQEKGKVIKLSNDCKPLKCRFCGKSSPEVKFRKIAHAFPECIGNHELRTSYECDECNEYFGKECEDNMAKYLGPLLTLSQTKGKNGVPAYKAKNKRTRIDVTPSEVVIQNASDSGNINIEDSCITINANRQPYYKIGVYKTLLKMALSLMPEREIDNFKETIEWVRFGSKQYEKVMEIHAKSVIQTFYPGPGTIPLNAILYKRSDDKLRVPYCIFYCEFRNFSFQIVVPSIKKDELLYKENIEVKIPGFIGYYETMGLTDTFGPPEKLIVDLSLSERVNEEKVTIRMKFDSKIELMEMEGKETTEIPGVKPLSEG